MFQEFPKCLVKGDDYRIVKDQEQEQQARADGYAFHSDEVKEQEPKKRGRPRKVEA